MAENRALAELAVVAGYGGSYDPPSAKQPLVNTGEDHTVVSLVTLPEQKDYFCERDGVRFAGTHLLIDLNGATGLDNLELIETTLKEAARVSGATILNSDFHHFEPNGGVSGVVVLAESHISIHTWPERDFAALDIFMCGDCNPYKAIPVLKAAFGPAAIQLNEQKRGLQL